jgi:hypothetical protein
MQIVDRVTSSGYSYVSPAVDKACKTVPLLGGIKQRIEPYAPPLIEKADKCIDTVYGVVESRATAVRSTANSAATKAFDLKHSAYNTIEEQAVALRNVVTSTTGKANKIVTDSAVVTYVHKKSYAIVDTLDMLIDRYLPEPDDEGKSSAAKGKSETALIPRMLRIPIKIPVRVLRISIVKARNGCDVINVQIQWAVKLTSDQKKKLEALILARISAIADKVSSSSLAITIRNGQQNVSNKMQSALKGIDDGRKVAGARCYKACEQLHVIQARDWTLKSVGGLSQAATEYTSDIVANASQRVYDATSFVAGQDRAARIFGMVSKRLPFMKVPVHPSASTGALSDSSSQDTEPIQQSSTGASGNTPKPEAVISPMKEESVAQEELAVMSP